MAYFYVDSTVGTRTAGGGTTKQTGSFSALGASNVYGSHNEAVTDGADTAGSIVCWSTDHANSGDSDVNLTGSTTGAPVTIVSVDASNCDTETLATVAQETSLDDVLPGGMVKVRSAYIKANDDFSLLDSANFEMEKGTIDVNGASDLLRAVSDGANYLLKDVHLAGSYTSVVGISAGASLHMIGGYTTGFTNNFSNQYFNVGGGHIYIKGTDLSSVEGYLIAAVGGDYGADDGIVVKMDGCKINSLVNYVEESFLSANQKADFTRCSSTSAGAEYQFHYQRFGGYMDDNTTIYRDESIAFPSTTKVSAHVLTESNTTVSIPFSVEFPSRYAELSGTSKKLRIYLASTATLTDTDVWFDAVYPDDTNNHQSNLVSTLGSNSVFDAGTTLTADTGSTWKNSGSDLAGYNEYYIDIDTSTAGGGDDGEDCVPNLILNVAIASTAIYFDTTIDVVS